MQHHSLPVLDPQYSMSIPLNGLFCLAGQITAAGMTSVIFFEQVTPE